ncbi:MAG: exonuclease SbcCD subunit D, partial [Nanoarchaeota archaeon]|nr:exonuclease SbcCD subunit D [Nanoarchaeota archaeon]
MNFSYAHFADLHLGAWRDPKMRDLSTKAFLMAMDDCIHRSVDFILFAGDLFNTSLPSLDILKIVVAKIKELQDIGIPLYALAGSHDFSPSGKTMLDVLENAGLLINVCKGIVNPETKELHLRFTTDPKTGVKMTGIIGRKGMLDRAYYENLARMPLEQETGYKIFLFHTTVAELLPQHLAIIDSQPISFFPKHFNYYAGGHIHHPTNINIAEYGTVTYPGALFPNNFAEVEKYGHGGYYIISVQNREQKVEWIPLPVIKHETVTIQCKQQSVEEITAAILKHFQDKDLTDTLITIRLKGTVTHGNV